MATFPGTTKDFKHGIGAYSNRGCRCTVCSEAARKKREDEMKRLFGTEPPRHGTNRAYSVYGCRCKICVSANIKSRGEYKSKLDGKEPPKHGLTGYSVYRCRCDICVSARNESDLKQRNNPEAIIRERERGWTRIGIKGFTWADFCKKYEEQEGKCFICKCEIKRESKKKSEVAAVDHNHLTGKVRALLCNNCNKMIGFAKESSATLHLGASYVELYREERCL